MSDFIEYIKGVRVMLDATSNFASINLLVKSLHATFKGGGKAIFFGNGGSAAEASHLAAEFLGKCQNNMVPRAAISLSDNISAVTAISNDWSFGNIYERQITALCRKSDFVVGMSTSGRSENVLRGLRQANSIGAFTTLWTSDSLNAAPEFVDVVIVAPTKVTHHAQEFHLMLGHYLALEIESDV